MEYRKAIDEPGVDFLSTSVALAHAYAALGRRDAANKILRDLELNPKAAASPYTMATIYAGLGENDKALQSLEQATSERSFSIDRLTSDMSLDSLRSDPRFQDLLRRLRLN